MTNGLPPLLTTSEPGSFARSTIVDRKPQIIDQVIQDNDYPSGIVRALEDLKQELARMQVRLLPDGEPDAGQWNQELAVYRGNTWLELPWYLAESYFYRRLLGAVRYFEPGDWQVRDPFGLQKEKQARAAVAWLVTNGGQFQNAEPEELFAAYLHSCLWGNRADLSNLTIRVQAQGGRATLGERHNILIDHTVEVADYLSVGAGRVDFINDNTGLELLFDLTLADFLLRQGWAHRVVLHLKNRPFFVSDAMVQDVRLLASLLPAGQLQERITHDLASGGLALESNPFWTTGLMFEQMPAPLRAELGSSDLVIIKGDVNYRRLLGDRHWPHDTSMESVTTHFPASFLVLRTLKGEIVVGLEPGQAQILAAKDPTWLINGRRGIVQLREKNQKSIGR
jgi:uncharacterized protein with ATP-grasp and redox domains